MACSLIVVNGEKKVSNEIALEFARIAGLRFIKLQHIKGAGKAEYGIRGFQSVVVMVADDREGGKHYKYELSKDKYSGEDCMGQRQLLFSPEKHTGMLTADLPDTPFNRKILKKVYFNNAQWRIVDPILDAEIRRNAEEFQKSLPNKPSREQVIGSQQDEIERLKADKRALEEKLKMNAAAQDAIRESATESSDDKLGALKLSKADEKKLRDEAKKETYAEMADAIKKLQDEKGSAWYSTKEYRETIAPVVEIRYQKKLEDLYDKHSGVSGDN